MPSRVELVNPTAASGPEQDFYMDSSRSSMPQGRKSRRELSDNNCDATESHNGSVALALNQTDLEEGNKQKRRESSGKGTQHSNLIEHPGESATPQEPFYFDGSAATSAPAVSHQLLPTLDANDENKQALLLPSHVTVLGDAPMEIVSQPLSDADDFIHYLDYDDVKATTRYYDEKPNEALALERTVCKNCGAEGDHKTSACSVQICLTCGARDEHSTRSCPISKVCFTCGMKGHINSTCPNRRTARAHMSNHDSECDRCLSSHHHTNECPSWWRLYEYLSSETQIHTLAQRQTKQEIQLGQGGEGYIANDEWCYNCGSVGHWGDDCYDRPRDGPQDEYSAFSLRNIMTGPFYEPSKGIQPSAPKARNRDWERTDPASRWIDDAPDHVGRKSRLRSRAALEKQAQEATDDQDDWFGNSTNRKKPLPRDAPTDSKKLTFGKSFRDMRESHTSLAKPEREPPSLLARLGDIYQNGTSTSRNREKRKSHPRSSRGRDDGYTRSDGSRYKHHEVERNARYQDSGPRYRGGYNIQGRNG